MIRCRECRFWHGHNPHRAEPDVEPSDLDCGECRRHAPAPLVMPTLETALPGMLSAYWPEVFAGDGCGDGEPIQS